MMETGNIERAIFHAGDAMFYDHETVPDAARAELSALLEEAKHQREQAHTAWEHYVAEKKRAESAEAEVARLRAELSSQKTLFTALMKDYTELCKDVVRMRAEVSENVWKNPVRYDDGSVSLALTAYKAIKAVEEHQQTHDGKDGLTWK